MRERSSSKSKLIRALVVIGVLFGIALLDFQPVSGVLRGVFHTVVWPFEKLASSVSFSIRDTSSFLLSIGELKRENEHLSEETVRLSSENAALLFLRGENESLRRDSGLEIRKKFDLMAAEVIAFGGESQRGAVVVDRGSVHGVTVGMTVVVGEGLLVGVVDEVYPVSARISLLTSSRVTVGGITVENGAKGVVRGDRGLGVLFGMILQSDTLREGDRVMTSGLGGTVPSGLYVGSIGAIRNSDDRLFREAGIISPVDFDALRFLFLVRGAVSQNP